MSTPVSVEAAPVLGASPTDLQARLQHMIDLQTEQQRNSSNDFHGRDQLLQQLDAAEQQKQQLNKAAPQARLLLGDDDPPTTIPGSIHYQSTSPTKGIRMSSSSSSRPSMNYSLASYVEPLQQLQNPAAGASLQQQQQQEAYHGAPSQQLPAHNQYGGADHQYGAVSAPLSSSNPQPFQYGSQEQYQLLNHHHQQQQHNPYMREESEYEEHYTGHDPPPYSNTSSSTGGHDPWFFKCCCLLKPLYLFFVDFLLHAEHLHRSFCYGAIDGMLTGSGIVAGFCGLGFLTSSSSFEMRTFVAAFCYAACFSDAVCMALGHVWTTHVVATAHARERAQQEKEFQVNKANMKGRLVEMLLAKGMLKIDAMSLADTLEGYPDLFVNALTGDTILGGNEAAGAAASAAADSGGPPRHGSGDNMPKMVWSTAQEPTYPYQESGANKTNNNATTDELWRISSYGQFNELEHDPEAATIFEATRESRREGVFMWLGFSSFAVLPSLIFLVIASFVPALPEHEQEDKQVVSAPSLAVFVTALVMWGLGVWKSRFLMDQTMMVSGDGDGDGVGATGTSGANNNDDHHSHNSMLLGMEPVVMLLICVSSAFGLGAFLAWLFSIDAANLLKASARTGAVP